MKEKSLSLEIVEKEDGDNILYVRNVREAVLNEIELIRQLIGGILTPEEFWERREKLFGDKLT